MMHQLIATYLFTQQQCPLMDIGSLVIEHKTAVNNFINKEISAPQPYIALTNAMLDSQNLIKFIAYQNKISDNEAQKSLEQFCETIRKELNENGTYNLTDIGNFYVEADGAIHFKEHTLSPVYFPPVTAERVIHPEAEHAILVGDQESTTVKMADILNEEEQIKKNTGWIWAAAIMFVIAIVAIWMYYSSGYNNGAFGNVTGIFD